MLFPQKERNWIINSCLDVFRTCILAVWFQFHLHKNQAEKPPSITHSIIEEDWIWRVYIHVVSNKTQCNRLPLIWRIKSFNSQIMFLIQALWKHFLICIAGLPMKVRMWSQDMRCFVEEDGLVLPRVVQPGVSIGPGCGLTTWGAVRGSVRGTAGNFHQNHPSPELYSAKTRKRRAGSTHPIESNLSPLGRLVFV